MPKTVIINLLRIWGWLSWCHGHLLRQIGLRAGDEPSILLPYVKIAAAKQGINQAFFCLVQILSNLQNIDSKSIHKKHSKLPAKSLVINYRKKKKSLKAKRKPETPFNYCSKNKRRQLRKLHRAQTIGINTKTMKRGPNGHESHFTQHSNQP